jgi:hypothetical protein
MRIIRGPIENLFKELYNIGSRKEHFVDGEYNTDGESYPYFIVNDIKYTICNPNVPVYIIGVNNKNFASQFLNFVDNNQALSKKFEAEIPVYTYTHRTEFCNAEHSIQFCKSLINIDFNGKFEELISMNKTGIIKRAKMLLGAVIYDPTGMLKFEHRDIICNLSLKDIVGGELIYKKRLLITRLGHPLGMYFSDVWKHYSTKIFGKHYTCFGNIKILPMPTTPVVLPETTIYNCNCCKSKLYGENYIFSEKKNGKKDYPEYALVCPWCAHSAGKTDTRSDSYFKMYKKLSKFNAPISYNDLLDDIYDRDLKIILKSICENPIKILTYNEVEYVDFGEVICLQSINDFIKNNMASVDLFKNKRLVILKVPLLLFMNN